MKTKKFKFKQLLKLHLLKSRIYENPIKKTNFNDLTNTNLDQILVSFKKALQVIFQYNQIDKRILFVGLPSKLEVRINSMTQHIAVSASFNIQGIISNNKANSSVNVKKSSHKLVKCGSTFLSPKLMKKPDLIVLFGHEKSHSLIAEAWIGKIPVIAFTDNNNLNPLLNQNSYFINGNFKSILTTFDKNIFFIGLNFLFKNLKKKKKSFSQVLPKSNVQSWNKNKKNFRRDKR